MVFLCKTHSFLRMFGKISCFYGVSIVFLWCFGGFQWVLIAPCFSIKPTATTYHDGAVSVKAPRSKHLEFSAEYKIAFGLSLTYLSCNHLCPCNIKSPFCQTITLCDHLDVPVCSQLHLWVSRRHSHSAAARRVYSTRIAGNDRLIRSVGKALE